MLGREGRVPRQLSSWCFYLWGTYICEARSLLALLQRAFLCGIWPCRVRMTLRYLTKSESWYLCAGLGNDKAGASARKTCLWLDDLLSQLKDGKVPLTAPSQDFSTCLIPSLFKKAFKHIPDLKHMLNSSWLQFIQGAEQHMMSGHWLC